MQRIKNRSLKNYLYIVKITFEPLTFSLNIRNTNSKLKRWKYFQGEYNYILIYKPDSMSVVADAHSRHAVTVKMLTLTEHSNDENNNNLMLSTVAPVNGFKN
jgi:hypothetical protein